MVERAGPGGEGNVIDHFSREALNHYLSKFDSAFSKHDIKSLRAFFNDSYEVDDARGAADWSPRLFEEFKKRRGYDLKEHLNSLFDSLRFDNPNVLYDYRLTISELVLDNFTTPWTQWASKQNKITRNQAHGSPSNILDLYSVVGIPEIEGTDPLRIKMASSAGNVSGKRLISSESATWLDEHFESDLGEIKDAVDLFLLNGVNHIFYHGTSYSPPGEPWPGWLFYAAVHLNPRNPQWNDFHVLNEYVARCQSFLQNSEADNDILLYYPIADPMSKFGPEMIEHFDGIGKQFRNTDFERLANSLLKTGYDFISDKQLLQLNSGNRKTIVVPACDYIPRETLDHLNKLAEAGVRVIMTAKPLHLAGLKDINKVVTVSPKIAIEEFQRKETIDLTFSRRKMDGRLLYFIKNEGNDFDDDVSISDRSVLLFDPMTGVIGEPGQHGDKVRLQLSKGQTIIVVESDKSAPPFPYIDLTGEVIPINTEWEVSFLTGGPNIPPSYKTTQLLSWGDFTDFCGTVLYKTHLTLPEKPGKDGWLLDLGDVRESVRVVFNGGEVGTLISPPFRVKIEPSMAQADNVLELHISNLAANRIASMDRQGVSWKRFYNINFAARKAENRKDGLFNASGWAPRPSGLLGPVRLLPIRNGIDG
ncbi:MAG TPA: glycosyl hydrolase, partial [Cyclobacteriaceae bacterium]